MQTNINTASILLPKGDFESLLNRLESVNLIELNTRIYTLNNGKVVIIISNREAIKLLESYRPGILNEYDDAPEITDLLVEGGI